LFGFGLKRDREKLPLPFVLERNREPTPRDAINRVVSINGVVIKRAGMVGVVPRVVELDHQTRCRHQLKECLRSV
jgi:hypothetical protein